MTAGGVSVCTSTVCWHVVCLQKIKEKKKNDFHPKILVPLVSTHVLTSKVAVVGWYHQQLSLRVLDNVSPMDGVRMAQKFVLVNINTPIQDLCKGRQKKRWRKKEIST